MPRGSALVLLPAGAAAGCGGLLYGFVLSSIAGAEAPLAERFGLGSLAVGLVVSNLDLGAAVGALAAGLLGDRLGRKWIILATAALYAVSSILTASAPGVGVLLLGRLLAGVAVGASLVLPLFLAEIAPARRRGFLVASVQLAIVTGILLGYVAAWLLVDWGGESWRWTFALGCVPAAAFLAAATLLPESPRWLAARGRSGEALAILSRVEGPDAAPATLRAVEEAIREEDGGWADVFRRRNLPCLGVGLLVSIASVAVGINAVIFYGPSILVRGGHDSSSALLGAVLLGAVNLVATLAVVPWIDRVGRRPLLIAGLAGTALSMAVLGATFPREAVSGEIAGGLAGGVVEAGGGSIWPLVSLLGFVAAYAVSLGPVTWVLVAEIFPTRARGAAMALCLVVMYVADFVVTLLFPSLMGVAGRGGFFIFASISVLAALLAAAFVPETKGKSLEEIEEIWMRGRSGARRKDDDPA